MYALDTNAFIHAMKGKGGVMGRLARTSPAELAAPAIVVYELEYGTLKSSYPSQRSRDLKRLLEVFTILPFNNEAASKAAVIRLELEQAGTPIGSMDTLIAATVLAHRCILVTNNEAEFSRVPGLQHEDWY